MLRKLATIIATLGILGTALGGVSAQTAGPNGGLIAGKGTHQTELVVNPTDLTVYTLHDGKPDGTKGVNLRAVIQQAGKTITISFADQGGKRMVAKLPAPLAKGAIVVLSGKDHHGDPISARYVIN